ncbi:GNAT family N-acetyltransferase [Motiliproteus sediminis]|uniref:GNAT family N-acetyltransferase n=1 Tax=Motiliproteus sediminis TaxID=1468178 RepID=UPI001AEFF22F|nr:GNAT family N-acetyltransferase [Motiliproteus sediminis]
MKSSMKALVKKIIRMIFGDYGIYHIYTLDLKSSNLESSVAYNTKIQLITGADIAASSDNLIQQQAWYAGDGSYAYGYIDNGRLIGVCFFWYGERYRKRNFWPLQPYQAKLVQIVSLPDCRGQGVAPALINYSAARLSEQGFHQLFARIWHSNTSSVKAFSKAGWIRIAKVIEVNPLRLDRSWKIKFK